jgi:hypothetical protein
MRRRSYLLIICAVSIFFVTLLSAYAKETKIIMRPGEEKQVVFSAKESVTFEFQLPKEGSCKLSLNSKSNEVAELNMGMMNALIKKGQPMVIFITRDTKNPKPTQKFVNISDKKTPPIMVELSEMMP